jgi:hypothetical protein
MGLLASSVSRPVPVVARIVTSWRMRLSSRMLALVLAATPLLLPTRSDAMEGTNIGGGMAFVLVPLGVAALVPLGANVYYTGKDLGLCWLGEKPSAPSARYELGWTGWQAGLLLPIALLGAIAPPSSWGDDQVAAGLAAFAMWPLALSAHGFWYAHPGQRWAAVTAVAAGDGLLLGYNIVRQAMDRRFARAYIELEIAIGAGQFLYGLGTTIHAEGQERWRNLGLASIPLLLVAHGVLAIADVPFPNRIRIGSLPTMLAQPVPGGMMLSLGDRW